MPTPDPPAIENTKFQTQYGISWEGSGVGIEMLQEKKVHTVVQGIINEKISRTHTLDYHKYNPFFFF